MKQTAEIEINASTEEKIKEAARVVFTRKGFAATRTRDIAEESGFNMALINYYFRSKEKLFDLIMVEHLQLFLHSIADIVNNPETSLEQKIEALISHYIDMLIKNPDLPLFVLSEVNANPQKLVTKLGFDNMKPDNIYLVKQWKEMAAKRNAPQINPLHMLMNVMSMTVFPFVASPLLRNRTGISEAEFNALMLERKVLIPKWINAMITGT